MIYATEQQVVATVVMVVVVALVALFTGILWGHRRGMAEGIEEARWAREQAKARVHPVYRVPGPPELGPIELDPVAQRLGLIPPEVAHEAWLAHENQALTLANEMEAVRPPAFKMGDPVTTGEIQAITDEVDAWMARREADTDTWIAAHVYGKGES